MPPPLVVADTNAVSNLNNLFSLHQPSNNVFVSGFGLRVDVVGESIRWMRKGTGASGMTMLRGTCVLRSRLAAILRLLLRLLRGEGVLTLSLRTGKTFTGQRRCDWSRKVGQWRWGLPMDVLLIRGNR